jgi:hypothetical protein
LIFLFFLGKLATVLATALVQDRYTGDREAARAFTGGSPEMAENKLYRNLESDLGPL